MPLKADECYTRLSMPFLSGMASDLEVLASARIGSGTFEKEVQWICKEFVIDVSGVSGLVSLAGSCRVGCTIKDLSLLPPYEILQPHIDYETSQHYHAEGDATWGQRQSVILMSVFPRVGIAPTAFMEDGPDHGLLSLEWWHGAVTLLDVRKKRHFVINNSSWRAMLQVELAAGYGDALAMVRDGSLFGGYECSPMAGR